MKQIFTILFTIILFHFGQAQTIDTLINVGSHKLHFNIMKGKGIPILFESGNGDDGSAWKPILQKIYDETGATLITYDRAGLGQSDIDTTTISFKQEIKDLNKALKKLGYKKNYFFSSSLVWSNICF
jgi:pimeloyl-ACP methyl ester carboxylesterase